MDLDLSEINGEFDIGDNCFKGMHNLQFLKFYGKFEENSGHVLDCLKYLPPKLRLLHWEYFPVTCLPSSFVPEFLVELNMPCSKLKKLWKGIQVSKNHFSRINRYQLSKKNKNRYQFYFQNVVAYNFGKDSTRNLEIIG